MTRGTRIGCSEASHTTASIHTAYPFSDIVTLNGIENPNLIRVGQKIVLEGPYDEAWHVLAGHVYDTHENVTHTVNAGDARSKLVRTYMPEAAGDAELVQLYVDRFA